MFIVILGALLYFLLESQNKALARKVIELERRIIELEGRD